MQVMRSYIEGVRLRELPRTPCPPELKRTRTLVVDGFKCLVYYVDNCWRGTLQGNPEGYGWDIPLKDDIETLEEACAEILPIFKKVIERAKKRYARI